MIQRQTPEQAREELVRFREDIRCDVVLEKAGYRLDKTESSRNNQKYRRGKGESIVVNHGGRGWWSPHHNATDRHGKGSVIDLVRFLNPGMSLGQARQELRGLLGVAATGATFQRAPREDRPRHDPSFMWNRHAVVTRGSAAWTYLTLTRALPEGLLAHVARQGVLREGVNGTAWFAHHDNDGTLTGMEMRGPEYRGFSSGGGGKRLFRFRADEGKRPVRRLVICESAIDALSFAALDHTVFRQGTLYVSTAGGPGPDAWAELKALMASLPQAQGRVIAAVDADAQGDRYAENYIAMGEELGLLAMRLSPDAEFNDWNRVLQDKRANHKENVA
ncbi:DUF3991 and TOPRIM domain-containing protein [Acetobacter sicerae]|uniref:DUF3991 and TOPRIM domain-containing protein n=1 Tax=Acetobacter sicerae TaxID=85325 RepID=UPI00156A9961|nr:DUF3991 and TOPRIM domain-containing protein [Acetobacter sicerae]NHN93547.1 DUF3991 domain-containing protein [Acetobacter sicerae]